MPSPFDLAGTLSAPQAGPTAAPRTVRTNPFVAARQRPAFSWQGALAGFGGQGQAFLDRLQTEEDRRVRGVGQQLIMDRVRELQGQGLTGTQMLNAIIASDEFAMAVGELPANEIFDFVQNTVKAISPQPLEAQTLRPGEEIVFKDPATGRVSREGGMRAPTTEEQNIAAIVKAEKDGDKRTAQLLRQRLLTKDSSGETSVGDALKLKAAGVGNTGNSRVDAMSPAQAQTALQGAKSDPVSMPENVLISRALGLETPDYPAIQKMSPEEAEAVLQTRKDLHGAEDVLGRLLQGLGKQPGQSGATGARDDIQSRRKAIRERKANAAPAGKYSSMTDEQLRSTAERAINREIVLSPAEQQELRAEVKRRGL